MIVTSTLLELELDEITPVPRVDFKFDVILSDNFDLLIIVVTCVVDVFPVLYTLYPSFFKAFVALVRRLLSPLPFSISTLIFDLSSFSVIVLDVVVFVFDVVFVVVLLEFDNVFVVLVSLVSVVSESLVFWFLNNS